MKISSPWQTALNGCQDLGEGFLPWCEGSAGRAQSYSSYQPHRGPPNSKRSLNSWPAKISLIGNGDQVVIWHITSCVVEEMLVCMVCNMICYVKPSPNLLVTFGLLRLVLLEENRFWVRTSPQLFELRSWIPIALWCETIVDPCGQKLSLVVQLAEDLTYSPANTLCCDS